MKNQLKLSAPLSVYNERLLDEREAGSRGHPTHVVLVPGDPHISALAPARAPAVLDQPVGGAGLLLDAITDGKDAMIEVVGAALLVPVHALAVELERLVAGVDGYTARALQNKKCILLK